MKMIVCEAENPTLYDVLATFFALRGYVEFRYVPLPECKVPMTPSKAHARRFTKMPDNGFEWNSVKGMLTPYSLQQTKDGNFTIVLRNMFRKVKGDLIDAETGEVKEVSYFADKSNAQEDGSTKIGFDPGEYQYRRFRLDVRNDGYGIDFASILVNMGGKRRLFPNARPNIRPQDMQAIYDAILH